MIPIVVLASGRGSNFEALQKAIEHHQLNAKIQAVVSDRPEALVLEKAQQLGIPALAVPLPLEGDSTRSRRQKHEALILDKLKVFSPKFLVLAGYMRILTPSFIEAFRSDRGYSRVVNIHPSLLPAFAGTHAYAQAFRAGVKVTGVTVHLVEPDVDTGPICAQESFSISDCQSESEVEKRGFAVEHRLYPETLSWVLSEEFVFRDQKIFRNRSWGEVRGERMMQPKEGPYACQN